LNVAIIIRAETHRRFIGGCECRDVGEAVNIGAAGIGRGLVEKFPEAFRPDGGDGFCAGDHLADLIDVAVLAAEIDGHRHRRRDQSGILAGEKGDDEIGAGFSNDGDALAALELSRHPAGEVDRPAANFGIGKGERDFAAQIKKRIAGVALGCVIQRIAQSRKTADLNRQRCVGARQRNGQVG